MLFNRIFAAVLATLISGLTVAEEKADNKINVSKIKIEMTKGQKSDFFTVYNKSDTEAFGFSVQAFKWTQPEGKDKLEPTNNIIAAPKTFVVQPRQYKNIRLVADDYPQALKDYSYRIMLSQISRQSVEEVVAETSKLKFNLTITMPLFFYSDALKNADKMKITTATLGDRVSISNEDNQHIYIQNIKVGSNTQKYNWYLLPQSTITAVLPNAREKVEIFTDRGLVAN